VLLSSILVPTALDSSIHRRCLWSDTLDISRKFERRDLAELAGMLVSIGKRLPSGKRLHTVGKSPFE
jgi:hypothetical protein